VYKRQDYTEQICNELRGIFSTVRYVNNQPPNGFGFAVGRGLAEFAGEAVAIVMADASDDPDDLVMGYRKLQEGYDCVFGSRFIRGGCVVDYPIHKLLLNRMANWFIDRLFNLRYNDTTNAFKLYRRHVIDGAQPLLSHHFNLTVELPLKAIVRGFSYTIIPMRWYNRQTGISKLKIKEMGSRYLFIVLYIWLERHLSQGDYHRKTKEAVPDLTSTS
jgi:dolichol-phosphate mannosyltransferase